MEIRHIKVLFLLSLLLLLNFRSQNRQTQFIPIQLARFYTKLEVNLSGTFYLCFSFAHTFFTRVHTHAIMSTMSCLYIVYLVSWLESPKTFFLVYTFFLIFSFYYTICPRAPPYFQPFQHYVALPATYLSESNRQTAPRAKTALESDAWTDTRATSELSEAPVSSADEISSSLVVPLFSGPADGESLSGSGFRCQLSQKINRQHHAVSARAQFCPAGPIPPRGPRTRRAFGKAARHRQSQ